MEGRCLSGSLHGALSIKLGILQIPFVLCESCLKFNLSCSSESLGVRFYLCLMKIHHHFYRLFPLFL